MTRALARLADTARPGRFVLLRCLTLGWLLICSSIAAKAAAQEGAPITSTDYNIDLTQGVVLSTSRVVGLAGAATALAEGVEGGISNPASVAARSVGSVDFWDYWLAFGLTYPFQNGDFYNSGSELSDDGSEEKKNNFLFLNTGAYLQVFGLGVGLNLEILQMGARRKAEDAPERSVRIQLITTHVQVGQLFFDGQLSLAGGLQLLRDRASATVSGMVEQRSEVTTGYGGELGMLIRPNGKQWRLGAGLYSAVKAPYEASSAPEGQEDTFVEPEYAVRPWRGNVGFAYQFGKRPLNPRFTYVEEHARKPLHEIDVREASARLEHLQALDQIRQHGGGASDLQAAAEREYSDQLQVLAAERAAIRKRAWRELRSGMRRVWSRRYVLLAAEMSFAGRVHNGVGVESFLAQKVQRSGEWVAVTPRLGIESEVWPTHVRVRAGSYVEATRFEETNARPHGTFGVDVRLLNWDVFRIWPEDYLWQLSAALDVSRGYSSLSLGFNGWY